MHGLAVLVLMAVRLETRYEPSPFPPNAVILAQPLYLPAPETPKPKPVARARTKSPGPKRPRLLAKRDAPRAAKAGAGKKFVVPPRPRPNGAPVPELTALALNIVPEASAPPSASLPKLAVAPAPPLKTDNFGAVDRNTAPTAARGTIHQTGFAVSEAGSSPSPLRGQIARAGFGAAETGSESRTPRRVSGSGGFDALPAEAPSRQINAKVANAEFGDTAVAVPREARPRKVEIADTSAAEILSKPRPAYTAEARGLGIEGEVLLDVLFTASGETRVLRLIRGLGHGLDESAADAARAIRFRSAMRRGEAVDSTAVVHIRFQLAY